MIDYTPAFPQGGAYIDKDGTLKSILFENGMSLRDYFAAQVLPRLINEDYSFIEASKYAYKYADAMMKEREKV